jgi:hypothetical protein
MQLNIRYLEAMAWSRALRDNNDGVHATIIDDMRRIFFDLVFECSDVIGSFSTPNHAPAILPFNPDVPLAQVQIPVMGVEPYQDPIFEEDEIDLVTDSDSSSSSDSEPEEEADDLEPEGP